MNINVSCSWTMSFVHFWICMNSCNMYARVCSVLARKLLFFLSLFYLTFLVVHGKCHICIMIVILQLGNLHLVWKHYTFGTASSTHFLMLGKVGIIEKSIGKTKHKYKCICMHVLLEWVCMVCMVSIAYERYEKQEKWLKSVIWFQCLFMRIEIIQLPFSIVQMIWIFISTCTWQWFDLS